MKKQKKNEIKAWAKLPDCSCFGESLQIYSSKKEAQNAINNMEARLYGINCLYKDWKPNFDSKVVPVLIKIID